MTKKHKKMLIRIIAAFFLLAGLMIAEHTGKLESLESPLGFVCDLSDSVSGDRL